MMPTKFHWLSPRKKPAWQVREPDDRTDPVEHEQFVQAGIDPHGLLMGASIRGKNHAHHGRWREDAFHFEQSGSFTIMAVADGVGSCPFARIGAGLACQVSVTSVRNCLNKQSLTQLTEKNAALSLIGECLESSVLNAIAALDKEAGTRGVDPGLLSTTLILVLHGRIASEHLTASLQVGDGAVALQYSTGKVTLLGKPDHGEYAGQSKFLTSEGIRRELGQRVTISTTQDMKHIAIMTDGISDDYFPLDKGIIRFFEQMEQSVSNRLRPLKAMDKWIRYEKVGSYDDRTLLLMSFQQRGFLWNLLRHD